MTRTLERAAAAAIFLALVAFSLLRVPAIDIPWHLATARAAVALGHWPDRNTFSYTFPDHPLYQQYPAYQAVLYGVFQRAGFAGLSVLGCVGWTAVFLMFVRWAGPWRAALTRPLLWAVALYALQRRISLRPDLVTMLALAGLLHALSAYARGRRWAIVAVPIIHLVWVRSHQLFPLSLLVQGMFVAHLALSRSGRADVDRTDAAVPIAPVVIAWIISGALCLATPNGIHVFEAMARTAQSLAARRSEVAEFGLIWDHPYELSLALILGGWAGWMLWRARRQWSPLEIGLYALTAALVLSAARGVMFFGILCAAIAERTALRLADADVPTALASRPRTRRLLTIEAAAVAIVLGLGGTYFAWIEPLRTGRPGAFGVGRAPAGWHDDALAFLRRSPPPGRMMNVPWTSGNTLVWGLPEQPVFVDPRLESYPLAFLRQVIEGYRDDRRLSAVIDAYRPTWIFAEREHATIRDRLAGLVRQGWASVYADAEVVVLVRPGPDTSAYRAAHRVHQEQE